MYKSFNFKSTEQDHRKLPEKDKERGKREMLAVMMFVMPSKELQNTNENSEKRKRERERVRERERERG